MSKLMQIILLFTFSLSSFAETTVEEEAAFNEPIFNSILSDVLVKNDENHVLTFEDGYEQSVRPPYSFAKLSEGDDCYDFSFNGSDGSQTRKICIQRNATGYGSSFQYFGSDGSSYNVDSLNYISGNCNYEADSVNVLEIQTPSCSSTSKVCVGTLDTNCGRMQGAVVSCLSTSTGICPSVRDCAADPNVVMSKPRIILNEGTGTAPTRPNGGVTREGQSDRPRAR